ncbi:uncharacterized protein B0T23DRAFT_415003 [Neurospora hispaniola]|uniref:Protein-serine/threonine kinase n=1 Tax=Neurospora hispaniola TaxID=588809 RepID=A0AAJ0I2G9_9PEZI|nr:hypothetical protein B0T23DRAFT_415003 [Neurospora hispaniola]
MPSYIVTLKDTATDEEIAKTKEDVKAQGGKIGHEYTLIKAFQAIYPEGSVSTLENHEHVKGVEADQESPAQREEHDLVMDLMRGTNRGVTARRRLPSVDSDRGPGAYMPPSPQGAPTPSSGGLWAAPYRLAYRLDHDNPVSALTATYKPATAQHADMKSIARPSRFPSPLKASLSSSNYPRLYSILNQNIARPHYDRPLSSRHELEDKVPWLANQPLHQLSLADLVKHGRPPLSAEALLSSARFTLSLLPIRLAHRIQALRNLPYIVVSNPNISRIYNNYQHSLSTLLPWQGKTISSLDDEIKFTQVLAELVQTHTDTIPILAKGFIECRKYISPSEVTRFLDEHLRARIGTRLVAEQHIALHYSSTPHFDPEASPTLCPEPKTHPSYIGVIDTTLRPASVIDSCGDFVADICELNYGVRPEWVVDGEPDATFAFVPMHLEYIVTELLKNAFRATVENGMSREPVVVTIAPEPASSSASAATPGVYSDYCPPNSSQKNSSSSSSSSSSSNSNSISISSSQQGKAAAQQQQQKQAQHGIIPLHDRAPGVTIRIRDRGGGINPAVLPNIWRYSFTTFNDADDDDHHESPGAWGEEAMGLISNTGVGGSTIAGLGYGLPLSRAYAEYFGGGIAVQSLYGWGTDVYLRLKGVGKIEY